MAKGIGRIFRNLIHGAECVKKYLDHARVKLFPSFQKNAHVTTQGPSVLLRKTIKSKDIVSNHLFYQTPSSHDIRMHIHTHSHILTHIQVTHHSHLNITSLRNLKTGVAII